MRKKVIILLAGLGFLGFYMSTPVEQVQAATYENRAVVRFYQEETESPENKPPTDNSHGVLPQTGASFSYMGIVGILIILFMWRLRKRKMLDDHHKTF